MLVKSCSITLLLYSVIITGNEHFSSFEKLQTPEAFSFAIKRYLESDRKNLSERCSTELDQYSKALPLQFWALKMLDATARIPAGLLSGNAGDLGAFDQCLNIKGNTTEGTIYGKYCAGSLAFRLGPKQLFNNIDNFKNRSRLYSQLQGPHVNPIRTPKVTKNGMQLNVHFAVCSPSSCSAEELEEFYLNMDQTIYLSDELCQVKNKEGPTNSTVKDATIIFLWIILGIILISTTYDLILFYTRRVPHLSALVAFSVIRNCNALLTGSSNSDGLLCLNGIRAISLMWIILAHRYYFYSQFPITNYSDYSDSFHAPRSMYLLEAHVAIDTLFTLNGLTISYNHMTMVANGGKLNILKHYVTHYLSSLLCHLLILYSEYTVLMEFVSHRKNIHVIDEFSVAKNLKIFSRLSKQKITAFLGMLSFNDMYLRFAPALAATVLVYATLLKDLGSGPYWGIVSDHLTKPCEDYWWSALLYVQNYVNPLEMCMEQSWYLSVDMQLFILSPIVLLPLAKRPKLTMIAVGILAFCSVLSSGLIVWLYNIRGTAVIGSSLVTEEIYKSHLYEPTHTRASPWLIGFALGYIIHQTKTSRIDIKIKNNRHLKMLSLGLWGITLAILATCVFGPHDMVVGEYDVSQNAFYLSLVRPAWSISLGWIIFACVHGFGGPVNWLLSLPVLQFVSKLSYSMYLLHLLVAALSTLTSRATIRFGEVDLLHYYWGDFFYALLISVVWVLAFEYPIANLLKIIFPENKELHNEENGNNKKAKEIA